MSEQWPLKKLGDFSNIRYGYTEKASLEPIGPRFLRITDIKNGGVNWDEVPYCRITDEKFSKYQLKKGDIVFARTGATTGKSFLITESPDSVFASYLIRVQITDSAILPEYVYLYFQSASYWDMVNAGISGSAQGGFNASKLSDLKIPIPPLEVQLQIVSILSEALENISSATSNVVTKMNSGNEIFQSALNKYYCKKEYYFEKQLGDVCKLRNGRAYKKKELLDEGKYRVLRVGNFFTNKHWYYSDLELDDTKYCDTGDLLYAWSASFGPRLWEGERSIFHYHIWRVDHDEEILEKKYLYYWFLWDAEKIKSEQGTGTTMIHVSMKSMNARQIFIPPLDEQKEIVKLLDLISHQVNMLGNKNRYEMNLLDGLKKSILQEAFDGKLTVGVAA
ncbi:restriction endonuclease subunit S [Euryarchaeota archaeon]|nr:restriction endonuclease subunit S [Euryarchaeota archaeon]|tara:strand:+ start:1554 stop:2729 length:1176 start_codon:yes stop_codon:yes gene_type:complete